MRRRVVLLLVVLAALLAAAAVAAALHSRTVTHTPTYRAADGQIGGWNDGG